MSNVTSELETLLLEGSLTDEGLLKATESAPDFRILPDATVLKIGGQTIMDRGRAAVYPVVEELVAAKADHQLLIGTGAGTRARHLYSIAAGVGLPTGVLTGVGSAVAGQNAEMLGLLMAKHGVPVVGGAGLSAMPLILDQVHAVIFGGMPPYGMWMRLSGARADPAVPDGRRLLHGGRELRVQGHDLRQGRERAVQRQPQDEPGRRVHPRDHGRRAEGPGPARLDHRVPRLRPDEVGPARPVRCRSSTGCVPGNITRALAGEHVGTIITAD